jgi:hypothetical protein
MKCNQCNNEFKGRADAKYCSPKCRIKANRNRLSVTKISVTDNPIPVTANSIEETVATMPDVEGEFEDLPIDVQQAIEYMSRARSKLGVDYEDEKALRTARALRYQQLFPKSRRVGTGLR